MGAGLLSPGHLIVVLAIALLVFGPKRLPELGRSLGSGMRGFKQALSDDEPSELPPRGSAEQPATREPAGGSEVARHTTEGRCGGASSTS
jgi:sec-independent protein translocase protein TatA